MLCGATQAPGRDARSVTASRVHRIRSDVCRGLLLPMRRSDGAVGAVLGTWRSGKATAVAVAAAG